MYHQAMTYLMHCAYVADIPNLTAPHDVYLPSMLYTVYMSIHRGTHVRAFTIVHIKHTQHEYSMMVAYKIKICHNKKHLV